MHSVVYGKRMKPVESTTTVFELKKNANGFWGFFDNEWNIHKDLPVFKTREEALEASHNYSKIRPFIFKKVQP